MKFYFDLRNKIGNIFLYIGNQFVYYYNKVNGDINNWLYYEHDILSITIMAG